PDYRSNRRRRRSYRNKLGGRSTPAGRRSVLRYPVCKGCCRIDKNGRISEAMSGTAQPHSEMTPRRFPPPWFAELTANCFILRDASRQALSYVYYESERGRRSAAKLLSEDEVRDIAANIAKLPGLLR